jgi:hypothetical protein
LDVVFVPTALDVLDHQAGLSNLRVSNHANFDDNAGVLGSLLLLLLLLLLCAP